MDGPILFAGDPHRNFAPILRACAARQPGALILLGDCECDAPLPQMLAPAVEAGWRVYWILGNRIPTRRQRSIILWPAIRRENSAAA